MKTCGKFQVADLFPKRDRVLGAPTYSTPLGSRISDAGQGLRRILRGARKKLLISLCPVEGVEGIPTEMTREEADR